MSDRQTFLDHFREIEIKKPSDVIIRQIRDLITGGVLKPGDRLPSERSLSEKLKISRGYVRDAIQKLEFYGILSTTPQRGTFVASLGVRALEGLISNVLNLEKEDFQSLMETRGILEIHAARLAAVRATDEDIRELEAIHREFLKQVTSGSNSLEEDLLFHLKISELSRNSVLLSLISLITPDIIRMSRDRDTCSDNRSLDAQREHEAVLEAIRRHDPDAAAEAMGLHMNLSQIVAQQHSR